MVVGNKVSTYTDGSGKITTSVFEVTSTTSEAHFDEFSVEIPDGEGMVCIGGGAQGSEDPGNMLTASFPGDMANKNSWKVSTKDHITSNPVFLKAWAIGIKIADVEQRILRDKISYVSKDGLPDAHPNAEATIDAKSSLLGGGFFVHYNGAGNIATGSFPSSSRSWSAQSKDMETSDPSVLTAYAIGIETSLMVGNAIMGRIVTSFSSSEPLKKVNHPKSSIKPLDGFALCGGGAEAHWHGFGQFLWNLEPSHISYTMNSTFSGSSKDHIKPEPGRITTYAMGVMWTPP